MATTLFPCPPIGTGRVQRRPRLFFSPRPFFFISIFRPRALASASRPDNPAGESRRRPSLPSGTLVGAPSRVGRRQLAAGAGRVSSGRPIGLLHAAFGPHQRPAFEPRHRPRANVVKPAPTRLPLRKSVDPQDPLTGPYPTSHYICLRCTSSAEPAIHGASPARRADPNESQLDLSPSSTSSPARPERFVSLLHDGPELAPALVFCSPSLLLAGSSAPPAAASSSPPAAAPPRVSRRGTLSQVSLGALPVPSLSSLSPSPPRCCCSSPFPFIAALALPSYAWLVQSQVLRTKGALLYLSRQPALLYY